MASWGRLIEGDLVSHLDTKAQLQRSRCEPDSRLTAILGPVPKPPLKHDSGCGQGEHRLVVSHASKYDPERGVLCARTKRSHVFCIGFQNTNNVDSVFFDLVKVSDRVLI